ncbi:MAG: STAS domain-containing protein [Anaerolineae bacterium]
MEVLTRTDDNVTILEVSGDIDGSSAPVLQEQVLGAIKPGCKLLLDMSKVEFMSSAGLRVMLVLYRQISGSDGKCLLYGLSQPLQDTMAATGFLKFFTLSDDLNAGLETLRQ